MSNTQDMTTVLCLFHEREQAQQALTDLQASGVPANSLSVIDGRSRSSATTGQTVAALQQLGLTERDLQTLSSGLNAGGTIIVVSGPETEAKAAESIFVKHQGTRVQEEASGTCASDVIPVVEEELIVGKRRVQRGGVRVYSRIVEQPVEEQIVLQEEHAVVDRQPVNRLLTDDELAKLRDQSIEVTETVEVPVVSKSAHVVEEVLVSKEATQHTEHITDTVRNTEINVEPIDTTKPRPTGEARQACQ